MCSWTPKCVHAETIKKIRLEKASGSRYADDEQHCLLIRCNIFLFMDVDVVFIHAKTI